MNVAVAICRVLLGLVFTIFGLNGFFHFIPQPPPASPTGVQYMTVLSVTHYFSLVFLVEVIAGILLLAGRFIPLALAMLAPVLANIVLYHSLMDPKGLPVALFAVVLWAVVFYRFRLSFSGIAAARPQHERVRP